MIDATGKKMEKAAVEQDFIEAIKFMEERFALKEMLCVIKFR